MKEDHLEEDAAAAEEEEADVTEEEEADVEGTKEINISIFPKWANFNSTCF